jgi:uncharacterized YigZ family protein
MPSYPIPGAETRIEFQVLNSHFIATAAPVFSIEEARTFISRIKLEFSDANHNVPAYIIGFGSSVTSHCSDDGEPSGTAGRPVLAVLSGSGLGDIAVVVTRFFGGTKLGTGGLVRAYSESVRLVIAALPRAQKILTHTLLICVPYNWFEKINLLLESHHGQIIDQDFAGDVTITAKVPIDDFQDFQSELVEASHGNLESLVISTEHAIIPLI